MNFGMYVSESDKIIIDYLQALKYLGVYQGAATTGGKDSEFKKRFENTVKHEMVHHELGDSESSSFHRSEYNRLVRPLQEALFSRPQDLLLREDLLIAAREYFEERDEAHLSLPSEDLILEYLVKSFEENVSVYNQQKDQVLAATERMLFEEVVAYSVENNLDGIYNNTNIDTSGRSDQIEQASSRIQHSKNKLGIKKTLKVVKQMLNQAWQNYLKTSEPRSVFEYMDMLAA